MEEKSFTHGVTLHKDGTYALQLNIDFGYMTPDDLITLGEIAKKYGVTCCAATTAKKATTTAAATAAMTVTKQANRRKLSDDYETDCKKSV